MINGFASITIAVPDLALAIAEYDCLTGGISLRAGAAYLPLANVGIKLVEEPPLETACIRGLVLFSESGTGVLPDDLRGLDLQVSSSRRLGAIATATGISAIDHVVLRTGNADDCVRLFNRDLGMRLALDQAVPEWGGRMLFFRCGKLTLEVIQHLDEPVTEDYFWGLTYLCEDLAATLELLDQAGVAHSELRDGRKPGTLVATVKSHHLGIPTLLIQPASR